MPAASQRRGGSRYPPNTDFIAAVISPSVARARVQHTPGAESPPLPVELVFKHNELLAKRLAALERDRAEFIRRELILEIEQERAAAVERAERQRKELEIEIERPQ